MSPELLKQDVNHIISLPEDTFLNMKDQGLIDTEIAVHENLLHSLTQRIAALKNHRNSLSQAWSLPIEVLSNIMLVATQLSIKENNESDVYPTTLPVPLVLGQVCSAWRALAWKLPELWATIPLAITKACYEKQVPLLEQWLARAGDIQDISIVLTLAHDETELQYWRDYPPKEALKLFYKRSHQWHTFYSTLPNLCFDLFASVHQRLPRLHTLILNRSGRLAYDPFINGFPGGINNLGNAAPNVIQNGVLVPAHPPGVQIMFNGATFVPAGGVGIGPGPGAPINPPLAGININIQTNNSTHQNPWYMLSEAPSLRTVVLPEGLNPSDITLPWSNLTHVEVRTIPIDECLRVLQWAQRIVSFDFHGVFSGPLTFLPTPHLHLPELRRFSVFSDPANVSRFLDSLTTPNLYSIDFKSTTGTLTLITTHLTQLVQRSGCQLRKLGLCIPSIGKSEEQIVSCLMGEEMRELEELALESWQVDVEGLSDSFLMKMNPERRIRTVRCYSYPLEETFDGGVVEDEGGDGGDESGEGGGSGGGDGGGGVADASGDPLIVAPGWVDVPMDEIREVVERQVEVPEGEWVDPQEILLPNLIAVTYRGTLTFTPQVLKDMIHARWKRKSRKRTVPRLVRLSSDKSITAAGVVEGGMVEEEEVEVVIMEEEEWYPTVELKAFEVYAPETDFREPIDEETNLVFRQMLREGFCLSVETKRGLLAF
ncbi:hypothetical protein AN958_06456 [Leucoagaricus sp. SymC.cos]|nr:hypothetical protein AN958_06456 [Leucoagaricus sp. SymC.cos]